MTSFFRRFGRRKRRVSKENDLDEELRFHLEEETREQLAEGLTAGEARQAARRDLGNITLVKEDTRAIWT